MKGYMYILRCANGEYYTGSTNNLEERLNQHLKGEGSNFTWKYLPVKLLYKEEFTNIEDAFAREKQIQKWSRAKKEALMAGDLEKLKALSKNHSEYKKSGFKKVNPFDPFK
jgi:putative endonuclease